MLVHQKMALIDGNPSFPMWRDLDLPIYQKFYFFNVTNPREVENGQKPNLVEVGPFVFRQNLSKSALNWSDDNKKLTFRETKQYYFDRELSIADLNITLTTLHVPLVVAYDTLDFASMNPVVRTLVQILLSKQSFFLDATPDELIFKGKKNPISCLAHIIDPKSNPDCYFAYFRGQNDTNDGLYEINTGIEDIRQVNSINSLNGSSKLDIWETDECNNISGSTNGELFAPLDVVSGENKTLQFFRSDFCRVFNLTRTRSGIPSEVRPSLFVDRFRPEKNVFANETVNPRNSCFTKLLEDISSIIKPTTKSTKISAKQKVVARERPSGIFDMSACQHGVPIFISWPHFLDADPIYLKPFNGLKPNRTRHQTYVDIEPVTGTPVDFIARIQVNVEVNTSQVSRISHNNMKSMIFPNTLARIFHPYHG
ncbi:CD36 [Blomia tropicalis]|nr:CD36 [Blomia tropicalis]